MNQVSSQFQTKQWRMSQDWYSDGKRTECEKFQFARICDYLKVESIPKCFNRLNMSRLRIESIRCPYQLPNGFEYSEMFDGKLVDGETTLYFNLKFVCGRGGAQMRTLQNVYAFIKQQYKVCRKERNVKFINILDGDECYRARRKFEYLASRNKQWKSRCFVGGLSEFFVWWNRFQLKNELDRIKQT